MVVVLNVDEFIVVILNLNTKLTFYIFFYEENSSLSSTYFSNFMSSLSSLSLSFLCFSPLRSLKHSYLSCSGHFS